jgi:hypothetical protein
MEMIVQNREGRIGSFLALALLVGIGVGLVSFVGGIMSWAFATLFFLFAILPLGSLVRPEANALVMRDGVLEWWNVKQGRKVDEGSVRVQDIRRIVSRKTSGFEGLAVVDIQLRTGTERTIDLPMYLHLSVNEEKIVSALITANPSIEIHRIAEPSAGAAGRPSAQP